VGGLFDQAYDDVARYIDVHESATTQSMGKVAVFSCRDVVACGIEQFERPVIAAPVPKVWIDRRMVVQIFTIVNRSLFDLCDGSIDLGYGVLFFPVDPTGGSHVFQMSTRVAQVGEGVQVCRMPSWIVGEGQCSAKN
jgi:hypothetical protein